MTTLQASPAPGVLDESEHDFISTFMTHVATLTGYGSNRLATIAGVKMLLLSAMAHGDGADARGWRALYRTIDRLIDASIDAHDTRIARAYLRSFLQENGDLA